MKSWTGYHGTTHESARNILHERGFRIVDNDYNDENILSLGDGAYFFLYEVYARRYPKCEHPCVLMSTIQCEDEEFLDLLDPETFELVRTASILMTNRFAAKGREYPDPRKKRHLLMNFICKDGGYKVVRVIMPVGKEYYLKEIDFRLQRDIMCVKDNDCISNIQTLEG